MKGNWLSHKAYQEAEGFKKIFNYCCKLGEPGCQEFDKSCQNI